MKVWRREQSPAMLSAAGVPSSFPLGALLRTVCGLDVPRSLPFIRHSFNQYIVCQAPYRTLGYRGESVDLGPALLKGRGSVNSGLSVD